MESHQGRRVHPGRFLGEYLPMLAAAVLIVVFAVLNRQTFLKTLPTLVTLAVQVMMARANRYGFLVGGCNAVLYGIGFLSEGLYFSAGSSILFSFPMQIYSFFHWKKHSRGEQVEFRIMPLWKLLLWVFGMLAAWILCMLFLRPLFVDASYPWLDSLLFVIGIAVTYLMAVPYLESQYLNLISGGINIVMWILIILENPANYNYLIISVYNFYRIVETVVRWMKLYRNQKQSFRN